MGIVRETELTCSVFSLESSNVAMAFQNCLLWVRKGGAFVFPKRQKIEILWKGPDLGRVVFQPRKPPVMERNERAVCVGREPVIQDGMFRLSCPTLCK